METVKLVINNQQNDKRKTAQLVLNNPHNLNAINKELYDELKNNLETIKHRKDIGVLLLSSEVSKAFSTGIDVKYIQSLTNEEASTFFSEISFLLDQITHLPIPTIAFVHGYAYGAGADLALSCDLRIAASSAVFRFPGPQFGLILGTQRLIHEIGPGTARYLTLLNKKIDAKTAKDYGLVHEMYQDLTEAQDSATNLIQNLKGVPYQTIQTLKELTNEQLPISQDLTRKSILHGDFQKRFRQYISKSFS